MFTSIATPERDGRLPSLPTLILEAMSSGTPAYPTRSSWRWTLRLGEVGSVTAPRKAETRLGVM